MVNSRSVSTVAAGAVFLLSACSAASTVPMPGPAGAAARITSAGATRPAVAQIQHIVVMVQENRSFDNLFATFPAPRARPGQNATGQIVHSKRSDWRRSTSTTPTRPIKDYDNGQMDGFDLSGTARDRRPASIRTDTSIRRRFNHIGRWPRIRARRPHVPNTRERQFHRSSRPHRRRTRSIDSTESIIDDPSSRGLGMRRAKQGTVTSLDNDRRAISPRSGTVPLPDDPPARCAICSTPSASRGSTTRRRIADDSAGALWNAFAAIDAVYNGPEWPRTSRFPETNILTDVSAENCRRCRG